MMLYSEMQDRKSYCDYVFYIKGYLKTKPC